MEGTPETLAAALAPAAVDMSEIRRRYGALLELVRVLIGVVPNCDPLLEIWPPGFRTYNLMVPNFLNLPQLLFGVGPPKDVVGLAMYASSRTAECPYCSAHTCSFALRRGAAPELIATAAGTGVDRSRHSPAAQAAMAAAEALSKVPSEFAPGDRAALERHFSAGDAERIALSVAMMGFLNKFMDAAGIPLEEATIAETAPLIRASGWSAGKHGTRDVADGEPPGADTLATKLRVMRYGPRAQALDRRWTAGVPADWPAVGAYLEERSGHDFPILARMGHSRPRRALATMLRDNLSTVDTTVGIAVKSLAGLVYASVVQDRALASEAVTLATAAGVGPTTIEAVEAFAAEPALLDDREDVEAGRRTLATRDELEEPAVAALQLAKACSPSPARVTQPIVAIAAEQMTPPAVIEVLIWLSVQQLLHRLGTYYGYEPTSKGAPAETREEAR